MKRVAGGAALYLSIVIHHINRLYLLLKNVFSARLVSLAFPRFCKDDIYICLMERVGGFFIRIIYFVSLVFIFILDGIYI